MKNNQEVPEKKPFYKKWWIWAIVVLFIIVVAPSGGDSPTTEVVEDTSIRTEVESVESVSSELQEYVLGIQSDVFPLMQLSNERIAIAGELGSQLEFESAQLQIASAKRFSDEAQEALSRFTPPQEAENVHNLLGQALSKYADAIDVYEAGIATFDVDTIYRGVALYQEATDFITQATLEFNKLQ